MALAQISTSLITVTLDTHNLRQAAHVAFDRGWQSFIAGMADKNGGKNDPFLRHVIGALGEVAFAKAMNLYYDGSIGRFAGMGNDVGAFQIRTRSADLPLILRPTDKDDDIFVLVYRGEDMTKWTLAGWIRGFEGKRIGKYANMDGGTRYLVDKSLLNSISELDVTA